jgi:hypothetical protein
LAGFRFLVPVAVLLGMLLLAPVASATHVACGEVLTRDTVLDSDIVCDQSGPIQAFDDTALVIGASNITVNGAGHRIVYVGRVPNGSAIGTKNGPLHSVALKNISATANFSLPLGLRVSHSKIVNVTASGSNGGAYVVGDRNVIRDNNFGSGQEGGLIVGGDHIQVMDNNVHGRSNPLLVEGRRVTVRGNHTSASFSGVNRNVIRDFAEKGIVTDNVALVTRYTPNAFIIEGGKVIRRNEVVCTNPLFPQDCLPGSG